MMKKILTLVGARPQFVKAAVVSKEIGTSPMLEECFVHSGQHYDFSMSEVFFRELGVPAPDYHMGVGSSSHGEQTGNILIRFEEILRAEAPDWVVIYGDTNTTLAGALAAVKLHIPVAHVEAGLRSFNRRMPEEINRIVADSVSDVLFAPSMVAVQHLKREGYSDQKIDLVGDVMFDVVKTFTGLAEQRSAVLEENGIAEKKYVLVTIHRAENTDDGERLSAIVSALELLAQEMEIVLPLHPRTRLALENAGLLQKLASSIRLLEPVGYFDMLVLEKHAALIVTDSGGVQKEAFFHRVPCVTVREETEWTELVDAGWNRLADPGNTMQIVEAVRNAVGSVGSDGNFFGDGRAAEKIVRRLESLG